MAGRSFSTGANRPRSVLNDPTYAGYSTGQWDGDTLVVDTVRCATTR